MCGLSLQLPVGQWRHRCILIKFWGTMSAERMQRLNVQFCKASSSNILRCGPEHRATNAGKQNPSLTVHLPLVEQWIQLYTCAAAVSMLKAAAIVEIGIFISAGTRLKIPGSETDQVSRYLATLQSKLWTHITRPAGKNSVNAKTDVVKLMHDNRQAGRSKLELQIIAWRSDTKSVIFTFRKYKWLSCCEVFCYHACCCSCTLLNKSQWDSACGNKNITACWC